MIGYPRLRDALRLQQASELLASYVHTTVEAYDADLRIGALLLDPTGRVLCERVRPPVTASELTMSTVIDPHERPLPADHPRLAEDHQRHERAYRRDDEERRLW